MSSFVFTAIFTIILFSFLTPSQAEAQEECYVYMELLCSHPTLKNGGVPSMNISPSPIPVSLYSDTYIMPKSYCTDGSRDRFGSHNIELGPVSGRSSMFTGHDGEQWITAPRATGAQVDLIQDFAKGVQATAQKQCYHGSGTVRGRYEMDFRLGEFGEWFESDVKTVSSNSRGHEHCANYAGPSLVVGDVNREEKRPVARTCVEKE